MNEPQRHIIGEDIEQVGINSVSRTTGDEMIALPAICHEMATFICRSTLDLIKQGKLTCPEPSARWDDAKLALAVDAAGLEVVVVDGKDLP